MGCGASARGSARTSCRGSYEDLRLWIEECMAFAGSSRDERHKASDVQVVEAGESEFLAVPPGTLAGVVEALYGAEPNWVDVKDRVMGPLLTGEKVHVSNTTFGTDPCPGELKTLRVRYMTRQHFEYKVQSAASNTTTSPGGECKLELVCPRLFNSVREVLRLDQVGYFQSLSSLQAGSKQASGKSGAAFFFTADGRFVIKSITDTELATLAGMLPDYIAHLKEHPSSLLARYLGGYRLTLPGGERVTLVAMNNVFEGAPRIDVMFDLKGTTEDRWVEPGPGRCLKDNNFAGTTIFLEDGVAKTFAASINSDTRFLEKRNIMDYSLMLGIVRAEDAGTHADEGRNIVQSYSCLMGGVQAIKAQGMLVEGVAHCYVFLGIVDMLVTYRLQKIAAHAIKSATIGLRNSIDTVPPDRYGERFRDNFARVILGRSEQFTLTPVPRETFEMPLQPLPKSGGTAAFFQVRCKECVGNQSRDYWIGKDLSRARDEVVFYEESKALRGKDAWTLLRWMTAYGGICQIPCQVGSETKDMQVMLIRNCRDGYSRCRMLDVKIGVETAVAGWHGKSAFAAWRQSYLDKATNSAGHGSRLEGFDSPPETLRSFQSLLSSVLVAKRQLQRFHIQCMTASTYLPLFLDLHSVSGTADEPDLEGRLTRIETQELVLLDLIQQLSEYVAACRSAAVPQQWIGSSVMLCFDCEGRAPREVLLRGPSSWEVARFHIFDWGRSELNTELKHERLSPEGRAAREKYWGYYCGGIAKLFYDCCALYVARFCRGQRSVAFSLVEKNTLSSDLLVGAAVLPLEARARSAAKLATPAGEPLTVGLLRPAPCEVEVSLRERPLPEDSRLQDGWTATVHGAQALPGGVSDAVVEVRVYNEEVAAAQQCFRELHASAPHVLRSGAHSTCVARGRPASWEESFELATLKPEAREPFTKALEVALGRTVTQVEEETLFPAAMAEVSVKERSRVRLVFAQQLFPRFHIDQEDHGSYGLEHFPENDLLRLLHFGEWLQDKAKDSLVFLLFFLARQGQGKKRPVDRQATLRFAEAFLKLNLAERWAMELRGALYALGGSSRTSAKQDAVARTSSAPGRLGGAPRSSQVVEQDAVVGRCHDMLRAIALERLQEHWISYDLQNQHASYSVFTADPTYRTKKAGLDANTAANQMQAAEVFARKGTRLSPRLSTSLRGPTDSRLPSPSHAAAGELRSETTHSLSEGLADRVARAVPLMITTLRSAERVTESLMRASSALCGEVAPSADYVERSRYTVPEGGCVYCFSPGPAALSFEAIGQAHLDRLRREAGGASDQAVRQELGDPFRPLKALSTNSKSGEVFLISADGGFIVKTISDAEANGLVEILPRYRDHVLNHPRSVLGRFVGLYCLELESGGGVRYVTVMQSVFKCPYPVHTTYDLKGSTYHRSAKQGESVRKDMDWIADGRRLELGAAQAKLLSQTHEQDTQMLSSCNVMDFSLLVGIAPVGAGDGSALADPPPPGCWPSHDGSHVYLLGIVDFLVGYGARKRAEHAIHEIKGVGQSASVTDPATYAGRQQQFLRAHVLPLEQGEQGHGAPPPVSHAPPASPEA